MKYEEMTGPQLVEAYNALIERADKIGQNTLKNVKKFSSREVGVKRCQALATQLNGVQELPSTPTPKPKKGKLERWYGISAGSYRDKLRLKLQEAKGPVSRDDCIMAVYGKMSTGSIGGVILGLKVMLKKQKAPFDVREFENEKKEKYLEIVPA